MVLIRVPTTWLAINLNPGAFFAVLEIMETPGRGLAEYYIAHQRNYSTPKEPSQRYYIQIRARVAEGWNSKTGDLRGASPSRGNYAQAQRESSTRDTRVKRVCDEIKINTDSTVLFFVNRLIFNWRSKTICLPGWANRKNSFWVVKSVTPGFAAVLCCHNHRAMAHLDLLSHRNAVDSIQAQISISKTRPPQRAWSFYEETIFGASHCRLYSLSPYRFSRRNRSKSFARMSSCRQIYHAGFYQFGCTAAYLRYWTCDPYNAKFNQTGCVGADTTCSRSCKCTPRWNTSVQPDRGFPVYIKLI